MIQLLGQFAAWVGRHRWALAVLLLYAVIVALCAGCSGSGLQEVTVPAEDPSVRTEPADTIQAPVAPVPETGMPTRPFEVSIAPPAEGPTVQARRFTVDRREEDQHVEVQTVTDSSTETRRYKLPAFGEALDIFPVSERVQRSGEPTAPADTVVKRDTILRAKVRGRPQTRQVKAEVPEPDEGWWGLKTELAGLGLLTIVAGLGGVAWRLRSFLPLPV